MQCPRCQHENETGAKFCEECAAPLARTCTNCGRQLSPTAKFCPECAHPAGAVATSLSRFTAPESYTPKHIAEKILTSKAALEGERKQVTVLFADLKGSMELLADRDPEEARKLLDPVLQLMMDAVHRYEGTVNQVMGDGIMALFGAPLAHEDHAVRACYAALRMQDAVRRYSDDLRCAQGVEVQIRVGLNSGDVVVRSIGSDLRMDYTAVGQTTHLAARMEQMAKPGSVLVTGETLKLAEGYLQVTPLGAVSVKGLETAPQVYELIGIGAAKSRLQATAARGLTRFVGREGELQLLAQAVERAAAGHGQTVAIVGEAGLGKSRLVWEFTRSHWTQGWLMLQSGSVSYGKATPYLPLIDLLKSYFRIQNRDDQREIRERVAGKILMLDRALEPLLTPLLALLDVPVDDEAWGTLDPPQRRQRTLEAVKRLLLRESQVQPLLLIFEDLHWIDSETQSLLDGLVESLPTARVLLLVNYRPEYQHAWGGKTYYTQLLIDPLPPASAEELLNTLLGDHPGLAPLKQLLIARTEGNPFFLEESVCTLLETGVLVGELGSYRLGKSLDSLRVPATVQTMLAARIDRLPPEDKRLLQTAAVIGTEVPLPLLQAIAELPEAALQRGLAHLQAAEFLDETRLFPDHEYTFKHALTQEVAYASLLQERRRNTHARIMEASESLYADRLSQHVERLARHAFRGEEWEKAVQYCRQAGTRAASRSANREAVAFLEQARAALGHLPEHRHTLQHAIDLSFDLRNALQPLGEFERIADDLRQAEALAIALGDLQRLGRVLAYLTDYWRLMGDHDRATEAGQRALDIADVHGDLPLQVVARTWLGQLAYGHAEYARAIGLFRRNVDALVGDLGRERLGMPQLPAVHSRTCLVWCLAEMGAFPEAITRGEEATRLAESAQHPLTSAVAGAGLGTALVRRGDFQQGIAVLERALDLCRTGHLPLWIPRLASDLGSGYAITGRVAEALALLKDAVKRAEAMGLIHGRSWLLASLGYATLISGDPTAAHERAHHALEVAREHKERGYEAWIVRLLGEVALRSRPILDEEAEARCQEARARATELGMRPLLAHCHLGLGKLYRRTGKPEQACEHLTTATTMYREMDMRFWLEQAETEMASERPIVGQTDGP
jgi:class 3 adenylate cyclase/tetratricopeptide (TPR) repeat protein